MQVDIGASRLMIVNHYCLRHGNNYGTGRLFNWELQASNSGDEDGKWITLKKHVNDEKLPNEKFSTADWAVEETADSKVGYRFFRILSTGGNSFGGDRLYCSGIELYGELITTSHPC